MHGRTHDIKENKWKLDRFDLILPQCRLLWSNHLIKEAVIKEFNISRYVCFPVIQYHYTCTIKIHAHMGRFLLSFASDPIFRRLYGRYGHYMTATTASRASAPKIVLKSHDRYTRFSYVLFYSLTIVTLLRRGEQLKKLLGSFGHHSLPLTTTHL